MTSWLDDGVDGREQFSQGVEACMRLGWWMRRGRLAHDRTVQVSGASPAKISRVSSPFVVVGGLGGT